MPTKTQAWIVEAQNGPFVLRDVELDDPLADELLVEMVASGVCHTDLASQTGDMPVSTYPVILGHEGAGRVLAVGGGSEFAVGDTVLLGPASCGKCQPCGQDLQFNCDLAGALNFGKLRMNGSTEVGTASGDGKSYRVQGSYFGQSSFGRHALVRQSSAVKVSGSEPLDVLAPTGCGFQTGAGAVLNVAKPEPHQSILISGLGGVGMAALLAAKSLGVKQIIAVDVEDSKLALAKELGATGTVNARTGATEQAMKLTADGKGVDLVAECTGVGKAIEAAFRALRPGGRLVQVGAANDEFTLKTWDVVFARRTMEWSLEGNENPATLIPRLVKMFHDGQFPIDKLVTKYKYTEMPKALDDLHHGRVIKAVLVYE